MLKLGRYPPQKIQSSHLKRLRHFINSNLKCLGLQPQRIRRKGTLRDLEIWVGRGGGGGGGGERGRDNVEKVGRTSGKILATPLKIIIKMLTLKVITISLEAKSNIFKL